MTVRSFARADALRSRPSARPAAPLPQPLEHLDVECVVRPVHDGWENEVAPSRHVSTPIATQRGAMRLLQEDAWTLQNYLKVPSSSSLTVEQQLLDVSLHCP